MTTLRRIRLARHLTQQQLAELSGVYVRTILKIELGEADIGNITSRNLKKLADALNVKMDKLLDPS